MIVALFAILSVSGVIKTDRVSVVNTRFFAMTAHYLFDPDYARIIQHVSGYIAAQPLFRTLSSGQPDGSRSSVCRPYRNRL